MSPLSNLGRVQLITADMESIYINEFVLERCASGVKFLAHLDATAPLRIDQDRRRRRRSTNIADTSSVIAPIVRLMRIDINATTLKMNMPPFNFATQDKPLRLLTCITSDVLRALDAYGMSELLDKLRSVLEQSDAVSSDPLAVLGIGLHTHSSKLVQLGIQHIFAQDLQLLFDQGRKYLSDVTINSIGVDWLTCRKDLADGLVLTAVQKPRTWDFQCRLDCKEVMVPVHSKWKMDTVWIHTWMLDVLDEARRLLAGQAPRQFAFTLQDFALASLRSCGMSDKCIMYDLKEFVDYCEEVVLECEQRTAQKLVAW
ncbi:hypothetical protein CYLTODRAFT_424638 [Cylindrobasidium torrendii FP15055 ss-10]|uniref:Uncharacterized protein n=1 Tax=Cylindrobasidium torrendii FP15055 ss-10 TaxID=1314674 RepID=A0A0D7B3D8_9AGAR|nr:hypothetical protein CYLTODRAFT_424638 [Cylindrobasidium torrendii FP15055 ss-10]